MLRPLLVSAEFRQFYPHPRLGSNLFCSKLDAWFDVGSNLAPDIFNWSEAVLGFVSKMMQVHFQAKKDFERNWNAIEVYLQNQTCLVDHHFSLADVVLALHLLPLTSAVSTHFQHFSHTWTPDWGPGFVGEISELGSMVNHRHGTPLFHSSQILNYQRRVYRFGLKE